MSIPEMQACLARLYVDDAFLRLFEVSGDSALSQYRLTEAERSAISGIDRVQLRLFADSLKAKRKPRFEIPFSMLFKINKAALSRHYDRFYNLRRIGPHDIQFDLTMEFGKFLEEALAADEDLPCYAGDLAKYERLYHSARFNPRAAGPLADVVDGDGAPAEALLGEMYPVLRPGVEVGEFEYDIRGVQEAMERGEIPDRTDRGKFHVAFVPSVPPRRAKVFRLTPATHQLLSLCDGRSPLSEIVDELQGTLGESDLRESIIGAIRRLLNLGVVELSHS